ncbi:MAG TPA: ABC transporter ATP-binding protein [Planctomycetes bacterium]|nr:ABC transporter ATP-binding protein [Planctomycetota bacterium]
MAESEEREDQGPPTVVRGEGVGRIYKRWLGHAETALTGFDLELRPGESVAMLGPNGAGKSTALRLIVGIDRPDRGEIRLFGKPPADPETRRRLAYLPDGSELFPFLDARETLDFFARVHGLSREERERRYAEIAEPLGVLSFGKKRTRAYSLGMRRRLGLAVVLLGRPELLVMDEPTSGLDPAGMELFVRVVKAERARGCALLFSSHHVERLEEVASRVLVLHRGLTVFRGTVSELAGKMSEREVAIGGLTDDGWAALRAEVESAGGRWGPEGLSRTALARWLDGLES